MRIETTLMTNICYDVFYAVQYLAFTLNLFFAMAVTSWEIFGLIPS